MPTGAQSSGAQRDLRIDFFRGLALLFIFIDHIPDNILARATLRNFGFADAAEVFVLLAGFSAVLAYGRTFEGQGFKAGFARVFERVREIYIWHLALVVICGIGLTVAAAYFSNFAYMKNIGVHVFAENPARSTVLAALLFNQPNSLNILPLYIVLMLFWLPFVLWLLPRNPWQALVLSIGMWAAANILSANLPSLLHPKGWVFNPFAWQLLITIGAMTAHFVRKGQIPFSRPLVWAAAAYLLFAFLFVAPWTQIPALQNARLFAPDMLGQIDKTYLSPWRLANVVALGYLVLNLLSPQSNWLTMGWATGVARCGRHSLEIFCLGTVLSFVGWIVMVEAGNGFALQILLNMVGIGILLGAAWALASRDRATGWVFAQSVRKLFAERHSGVQQLQA
ncbi:MAG: OpgC domain-containing protein [Hyphomicrobium sp.]|jgi:hypothetical protein